MEEIINSWNNRWYPYCLKLVFHDFHKDIKDFLQQIVFSQIDVILFAKKRTVKIIITHNKTKEHYSIIMNEFDSLILKETSFVKWSKFFTEYTIENKEKFNQTLHQLFMEFGISTLLK